MIVYGKDRTISNNVIVGCSSLAGLYSVVDEDQNFSTIDKAIELGFRLFDTAPHYGCGLGEIRLGKALYKNVEILKDISIYTKVGRIMLRKDEAIGDLEIEYNNIPDSTGCIFYGSGKGSLPEVTPCFDFSAAGVRRSFRDSCHRLGVSSVFGLRIHDCESESKFISAISENGGLAELVKMRSEGLIKEVSLGMNDPHFALRILRTAPPGTIDTIMIAGCWNLLDHDESALELLLECQGRGVRVHNAGIFASSVLVGGSTYKYAPADVHIVEKTRQWQEFASIFGIPLPALAMAFALLPVVVEAIAVGVKSPDEVKMACDCFSVTVPRTIWMEARARGLIAAYVPL